MGRLHTCEILANRMNTALKIQSPSAGAVRANRTSGKPSARVFAQVRDNTPVVETVEEVAKSSKVKVQKKMSAKKGKVSCDGVFAPAVQFTRAVIGDDKKFNKIRGKAISLHSQVITAFCDTAGMSRQTRMALIKEAKS